MAVGPILRRGAVVCVLLTLLFATSGSAQPDDPEQRGDIRHITVGDFWNFTVSGHYEGWVRSDVVGAAPNEEHGPSLRIEATGELRDAQDADAPVYRINVTKFVRQSDHATVRIEGVAHASGSGGRLSEHWTPPLVEAVHPIAAGLQWEQQTERSTTDDERRSETSSVTLVGRFVEQTELTVAAGTFDTWRVRLSRSDAPDQLADRWYAEEACELVREDRTDAEGGLLLRYDLHDYACRGGVKATPSYDGSLMIRYDAPPAPVDPGGDMAADGLDTRLVWSLFAAAVGVLVALYVVGRLRAR